MPHGQPIYIQEIVFESPAFQLDVYADHINVVHINGNTQLNIYTLDYL